MQISKVQTFRAGETAPEATTEPKKSSAVAGGVIGAIVGGGTGYFTRKTIDAAGIQALKADEFESKLGKELSAEQKTAVETIKAELNNTEATLKAAKDAAAQGIKDEISVEDYLKGQAIKGVTNKGTLTAEITKQKTETPKLETVAKETTDKLTKATEEATAKTTAKEAATKAVEAAGKDAKAVKTAKAAEALAIKAEKAAKDAEATAKLAAESAAEKLTAHSTAIKKMETAFTLVESAKEGKITTKALQDAAEATAKTGIADRIATAAKTLADKLPKGKALSRTGWGAVIGIVAGVIVAKIIDSSRSKKETPAV